jgi:hypothetical protein
MMICLTHPTAQHIGCSDGTRFDTFGQRPQDASFIFCSVPASYQAELEGVGCRVFAHAHTEESASVSSDNGVS